MSEADPSGNGSISSLRLLWRHRARVIEALAWLLLSRALIGLAPFQRWEPWLGKRVPVAPEPNPAPSNPATSLRARRIGRAVDQAANRLPMVMKCLPRAMATQWMLRRRKVASRLLIGVLPPGQRGTADDLHAWVVVGTETVIGELGDAHRPVLALKGG